MYYKLGADIVSNDADNTNKKIVFGYAGGIKADAHLDLAGHKIERTALTTNSCMFGIELGKLTVDDSVGGGVVNCKLTGGKRSIFGFSTYRSDGASLEINGGTFNNLTSGLPCFTAEATNGTITINDGTFTAINALTLDVSNTSGGTVDVAINGGTFTSAWDGTSLNTTNRGAVRFCPQGKSNQKLHDCTVNGGIEVTGNKASLIVKSTYLNCG